MSTAITDLELQVPDRFVALFRLSLIDEVRYGADWVKDQGTELAKFYEAEDPIDHHDKPVELDPETLEARLADLSAASRSLSDDHNLLERISRHNSPQQDLTVRGSFETLHGALQATVRRAAKDMVNEGEYSPIDGARLVHRAAAATWAAEQSARLTDAVLAADAGITEEVPA